MFVTDDMIAAMAARYGLPHEATFHFEVLEKEYRRILGSQKNGRNHDVTVYMIRDGQVAVIAKPFYPPGLYRAPSGGLQPGEDFRAGVRREILEEVGCEIRLTRFLLKTAVSFTFGNEIIHWRSFVFLADYVSGDFSFTDHREIREVRLVDWEEFATFARIMRQTDIGGLHYRAALHEMVERLV